MVRNYNQHSREIVELKSGSNSQKEITNGNKCLLSQVSWLGTNVSKLFAEDWKPYHWSSQKIPWPNFEISGIPMNFIG